MNNLTDPRPHSPASKTISTSTIPSPPFLDIQGVSNFRDLGSYPCRPPSSPSSPIFPPHKSYITRPGTLFRSAQLTNITRPGATTLSTHLRIRRLYDLRSEREIKKCSEESQPTETAGIERVFVPVFRDQDASPEGLARKYKNYTDPEEDGHSAGFVRAYRDIFLNAGPAYKRIFEHIRDYDIPTADDESTGRSRPEPLLFHCAAGKDRTGVFAALVLRLCGVPDEIIAWEYSITALGLGPQREVIIAHLMKGGEPGSGTPAMTREQAERAIGSRATNMRVFLNEVLDREGGGVESYMQEFCGLSAEDVETIRHRLVVEGASVFGDGTGFWKPDTDRLGDGAELGPLGLATDTENGREREARVMTG